MNKGLAFAAGLGLGTGIMYLLDPDRGRRRRAFLRDKCALAARKTGEGFEVTARDIRNRTHGIVADLQSRFSSTPADDSVLVDRVRSKMGRIVSHPGAIEVAAQNGKITLSGPILTSEAENLLSCIKHVNGVNEVINNLEAHEQSENHPALQGGRERPGDRFEFLQEHWSPAARFVAGAAGASLAAYAGVRRDAVGAGLGAAGLLLLTRGVTNTGLTHLLHLDTVDDGGEQQALRAH